MITGEPMLFEETIADAKTKIVVFGKSKIKSAKFLKCL